MNRESAIKIFKTVSYIGIYGGLLMPLVFIPVVIFPFVFSKLIAFQILIGLTFPAYVALAWMDSKFRPPKSVMYLAIIAYFIALLLSTIFSVDPVRSWWGNQERMNGLFTLLHFFAWLTMAIGVLKHWRDWYRLLNFQVVLAVIMAIVALLQIPFPKLLSFEAGSRVGGFLDNPIYMGAYQIFNLAFVTLLFIKTKDKLARIWYVVAALFMFAAFLAAQSRGAMVGLAAFLGIFALYYAAFTKKKKVKWGIFGTAFVGIASYATLYVFRATSFVQSIPFIPRFLDLHSASETRLIAWKIAWDGFLERPLTGWGFDAFHILFNLKYNPRSLEFGYYETWFDRAHNTVMDVLAMTGLFGFITYFAIFITLFYLVWRAWKKGWIDLPIAAILTALPVGYFLQNLFVFDHPAAFSMSYLLFALVIAATRPTFVGERDEKEAEKQREKKSHAAPWIAFALLQLVTLFIAWRFSVLPFRASVLAIRGNTMLQSYAFPDAWALMQEAGSIPTPYLDEQTFLLSRDLIELKNVDALSKWSDWLQAYDHVKLITEKHLSEHPRNTHPLFIYARLLHEMAPLMQSQEAQIAEAGKAEEVYRRAIDTSPKRQQLHYGLARLYSMYGQNEQAFSVLQDALSYNENIGESWWYVGLLEKFDLGREEEGSQALLNAVNAKASYQLRNVQEALMVAQAAERQGDTETLKKLLGALVSLPGGSQELYLNMARAYEGAGLIEERNSILNALQQLDAGVGPQLKGLYEGRVDTIDESINEYAGAVLGTSTSAGDEVVTAPEEVPSPPEESGTEESSEPMGPGPRR